MNNERGGRGGGGGGAGALRLESPDEGKGGVELDCGSRQQIKGREGGGGLQHCNSKPIETQINLDRGLGFRDPVRSRAVAIRITRNTSTGSREIYGIPAHTLR